MMYEHIDSFTQGLVEKTREGKLQWMPLSSFQKMRDLNRELDNGFADIDFGINSIRESASYFLRSEEGYVFLFEIYHGDPEVTSPEMDTLQLMVKINSAVPVINLSSYMKNDEYIEMLETLKLLIESYIEEKYCMPNALYEFMNHLLREEIDNEEGKFVDFS